MKKLKQQTRERLQQIKLQKIEKFTDARVRKGLMNQDRRLEKLAKRLGKAVYGKRSKSGMDGTSKQSIKERHSLTGSN